jgi:hypothetical protein
MKQTDVLRAFADGLDAAKAPAVRDILRVMYRAFESEGEPDAVDWMDNDVVGFWSPSYRMALNKAGQKIWDAVSAQVTDGGDEATKATSVDKIVLFLFRCPPRELAAFHKALKKGKQEDTNVYQLKLRPGLKSYLAKQKPRPKAAKHGGANTNAAVLQYISGLKYPERLTALKAMIPAAIGYNGDNPMYYIVESAAKALKLDREALHRSLLVDAENLTVVSAEKLVRYLLNVPTAVTHAVRKDMEREAAKKARVFADAGIKVRG